LVAPVLVAVVFGLAADPRIGLAAGALTALAIVVPLARWPLAFGGALALAAAGAYVALQQYRYAYPPDFAWPTNTPLAHELGWFAVALVTATAGRWQYRVEPAGSEESLKPASPSQQNRNEDARVHDAL
jgi:hypothetical protein